LPPLRPSWTSPPWMNSRRIARVWRTLSDSGECQVFSPFRTNWKSASTFSASIKPISPRTSNPSFGTSRFCLCFPHVRTTRVKSFPKHPFSLNYWRTADGKEVDFVLQKDAELLPIEVKSSWKPGKLPPGLRSFLRLYPETQKAVVLYDGPEHSVLSGSCTIQFAPLYKAQRILDWM